MSVIDPRRILAGVAIRSRQLAGEGPILGEIAACLGIRKRSNIAGGLPICLNGNLG